MHVRCQNHTAVRNGLPERSFSAGNAFLICVFGRRLMALCVQQMYSAGESSWEGRALSEMGFGADQWGLVCIAPAARMTRSGFNGSVHS